MRLDHPQHACPSDQIAAYLDGELMAEREIVLDAHFASCRVCREELNSQKQFLHGLESTLRREANVDLPDDFTRRLVANAESSVAGLRRPRELYNAIFITAGLALFGLFAVGPDAGKLFAGILNFLEQTASIIGIVGRMLYSIFVGAAIIIRSLASHVSSDGVAAGAGVLALLLMTIWFASRTVLRMRRA